MNTEKTDFNKWFDIHSRSHLTAYQHFTKGGEWPKHFIPADINFGSTWETDLLVDIADAWINERINVQRKPYEGLTRTVTHTGSQLGHP